MRRNTNILLGTALTIALTLSVLPTLSLKARAALPPNPQVLALAGANLPNGAVVVVNRVDHSAVQVNNEGIITKPDSHGNVYIQLGGRSSLIEHILLPPFQNNALREVWLLATIFPNVAAAAQAYSYDSDMGTGCSAFSTALSLVGGSAHCAYQDSTSSSRQTGLIVATTAGRVEFLVAAFVNSAIATAPTRVIRDAIFVAQHEATRAIALFPLQVPSAQPTRTALRPQPTATVPPSPSLQEPVVLRTLSLGKQPVIEGLDAGANRLIVATGDQHAQVSLVDARSGVILHTLTVDQAIDAAAVDPQSHVAYVVGNLYLNDVGDMYWFDTRSGHVLRTLNVGYYPDAVAFDRISRRVFVANSSDDDVMVFSMVTGSLMHTNNVGKSPSAIAVDAQDNRAYVLSTSDNTITVLDATTGRFIKTIAIPANAQTMAVLGPQNRLVTLFCPQSSQCGDDAVANGSVALRDGGTGALIYSGSLGQAPMSMTYDHTLNQIVVFDVGTNAALFLDPVSGRTLRRLPLGSNVAGIAVLPHANCIAALGLGQVNGDRKPLTDGDLRIYNLRTGRLIGHLDVPESTDGIIGDDGTGRLFLTNSMNNTLETVNPLAIH